MKVLVVGDIIIDGYTYGEVSRLAPDFIGPVFDVKSETVYELGGAGNVAKNIKSLLPNAEVHLQGSIDESKYNELLKDLIVHKISEETMIKERIIAEAVNQPGRPRIDQKIIRIDTLKSFAKCAISAPEDFYDIVVISDYNKGTINKDYKLPKCKISFMDSKRKDLSDFKFIDVIKLNNHEFEDCKNTIKNKVVIVTHGNEPTKVLVDQVLTNTLATYQIDKPIINFNGAGDAFLAGLVYAYTINPDIKFGIMVASMVAAISITKPLTPTVTLSDIEDEINGT